MAQQNPTVADYVMARLAALGIKHVFGVPGDYAFPWNDAAEDNESLTWVGNANELNAAYAGDGYARTYGASIVCTTYCVGEISALTGVMGARAENSAIFHITGMPSTKLRRQGRIAHHMFKEADYGLARQISAFGTCAQTELTPENAIAEMERVIAAALTLRQPVHITAPQDYAVLPVVGVPVTGVALAEVPAAVSDPGQLDEAVNKIAAKLSSAQTAVLLPSHLVSRFGLQAQFEALLSASGMGFATPPMAKAVISETHPQYLGIYNGALSPDPGVKAAVEAADVVLDLGNIRTDVNTGAWTDFIDPAKRIVIDIDSVGVDGEYFAPVTLADVLTRLAEVTPRFKVAPAAAQLLAVTGGASDLITSQTLYPRIERYLQPNDIVVSDAGSCATNLLAVRFPEGATFQGQRFWGCIGWGTPAAFGVSMAAPDKRVVFVTGDGGHQLTANDIGAMGRYGAKPIILLLNNGMFAIEEALNETQKHMHPYDYLAPWEYHKIPEAMGCSDWFTVRVETLGELDDALAKAAGHDSASYIEVMLPVEDIPQREPVAFLNRQYGMEEPA